MAGDCCDLCLGSDSKPEALVAMEVRFLTKTRRSQCCLHIEELNRDCEGWAEGKVSLGVVITTRRDCPIISLYTGCGCIVEARGFRARGTLGDP